MTINGSKCIASKRNVFSHKKVKDAERSVNLCMSITEAVSTSHVPAQKRSDSAERKKDFPPTWPESATNMGMFFPCSPQHLSNVTCAQAAFVGRNSSTEEHFQCHKIGVSAQRRRSSNFYTLHTYCNHEAIIGHCVIGCNNSFVS